MKKIFWACTVGLLAVATGTLAFCAFASAQNKWCYIFQAYYWPQHEDGKISAPVDFHGIWHEWSERGILQRISVYSTGTKKMEDWYVEGIPWMRVSYLGTSGAACGYEYRFSRNGEVTFVGTYLEDRPGELITIYDPTKQVDLRSHYKNVLARWTPLPSPEEANQPPEPMPLKRHGSS